MVDPDKRQNVTKILKIQKQNMFRGGKKSLLGIYLCSIVDEVIFGSKTEKMKIQNPHFKHLKCTKCICNRI